MIPIVFIDVRVFEGQRNIRIVLRSKTIRQPNQLHYASDGTIKGTILAPNQFSSFCSTS